MENIESLADDGNMANTHSYSHQFDEAITNIMYLVKNKGEIK